MLWLQQFFVRSFSCVVHPTQSQTSGMIVIIVSPVTILVVSQFLYVTDEDNLIGDHTKPYCLPIEKGANPLDLKCVSPQTVSDCYYGNMMQ